MSTAFAVLGTSARALRWCIVAAALVAGGSAAVAECRIGQIEVPLEGSVTITANGGGLTFVCTADGILRTHAPAAQPDAPGAAQAGRSLRSVRAFMNRCTGEACRAALSAADRTAIVDDILANLAQLGGDTLRTVWRIPVGPDGAPTLDREQLRAHLAAYPADLLIAGYVIAFDVPLID